ncbi:heme peroxidase [Crassisporium funariophilum]|nr:heme peroxidase [Crassisporium funariophilum]
MKAFHLVALLAYCLPFVKGAKWPAPEIDEPEALLYERGHQVIPERASLVLGLADECTQGFNKRSNAAEIIRLAYHDSATYDIEKGTGGLDASIRFPEERERPENVGAGMSIALRVMSGVANKYVSHADVIAVGLVTAVQGCGGPIIPYRSGRVDAPAPGPSGVPEPFEDLATHTASFKRQGFNQEEMIGLVACGHTLGGVRDNDFPDHVPKTDTGNGQSNIVTFDSTPAFDNAVVTEYLDGTTQNPLIAHPNTTMLSDLRIFSSDQNATMTKLADPQVFDATCRDLLERMINTVPNGVKLSEVIEPIPVKVGDTLLSVDDKSLVFRTSLRLLKANPNRLVTLHWVNRNGTEEVSTALPYNQTDVKTRITARLGLSPVRYWFSVPLETSSISKFWFTVDESDGSGPQVYDNDKEGYNIVQDSIIFSPQLSRKLANGFELVVAARNDVLPSRVSGEVTNYETGSFVDETTPIDFALAEDIPAVAGYSFYKTTVKINSLSLSFDVTSVVGDKTITQEFLRTYYVDPNIVS